MKNNFKEINSKIFKAYDIRGVYPDEVNEDAAYLIGRSFVKFLKKNNPKIVVGQDNRLSSSSLFKHLSRGITDQGADVVDIGLSPTPMFYFSVAKLGLDGGINITASHNPAEYNGFKMVRENAIPISGETGIEEIKNMVLKGEFGDVEKGKIVKKEVLNDYLNFNFKGANLHKIKPLKIVVDTANGVAGILIPEIFEKLNVKLFHIYSKLDGRFPNHNPDPLKKENLRELTKNVIEKKADLGISFDGDGDRIVFINEKGEAVSGDLITALLSQLILKKERSREKILYDVRSSNIVKEIIKEFNGIPVVWKIGHSFIKEKMRKEGIIFAGEFSGHYYHRNHYFCECPIFILLKILELISQSGKTFSEIIKPFQIYFHSGEINFEVGDKEKILQNFEKRFKAGRVLKIDGLRIDFKDWWFLVRPSNTEPVIRMVVEAKTKDLLKEKIKELSSFYKQIEARPLSKQIEARPLSR